jgi:DNA-binding beta-propeller fold protein YncE
MRRLPVIACLALLLVGGSIGFPSATHAVSSIGKLKDEGKFELTKPWGVATDEFGDIYVVDSRAGRVVKFDRDTHQPVWATLGGTGSEAGQLFNPQGIAIGDGLVYVADTSNHRISMFTYEGQPAGDLLGGDVPFAYPADVDFRDGYLYVTNGGARCTVDRLSKSGSRFSRAGVFGGCGSDDDQFTCPSGVAVTQLHL